MTKHKTSKTKSKIKPPPPTPSAGSGQSLCPTCQTPRPPSLPVCPICSNPTPKPPVLHTCPTCLDDYPLKHFRGHHGVIYEECRRCRNPRQGREGLNGYGPQAVRPFVLPPGCEVLDRRYLMPGLNGGAAGEGVKVLTDPVGNPVTKRGPWLGEGEVCLVLR